MKLRILIFILACLALANSAEAERIWFGPSVAFPIPAGDIADDRLGVDVGLTFNRMERSHLGVGIDIAYQYWPATSRYTAAYDRYLRSWFQTIDSPYWSFSALQISGHLKFVGPVIKGHAPYAQIGGGFYRLDRNFGDPNWAGSPVVVGGGAPKHIDVVPGWHAGFGIDFRAASTMVLGLNATYETVSSSTKQTVWGDGIDIPAFSAFTVGTHVLFGR